MNQTTNEIYEDLYENAQIEEDVPFNGVNNDKRKHKIEEMIINNEYAKDKRHNRWLKSQLTNWGFRIIKYCFITIILLYVIDTILININCKNSSLIEPIFDLAKSSLTFLIGFLFANNEQNKI